MRRLIKALFPIALLCLAFFWILSAPSTIDDRVKQELAQAGGAELGQQIFWAGGCSSCHSKKEAKADAKLLLGGDHALVTPVGTFNVPNISPHKEHGIGSWSIESFANAMLHGTSPDGRNYYPAFPYTSYTKMTSKDIADLWAYMQTLEAVATENIPHDLSFPFNISRGIGLWKLVFLNEKPLVDVTKDAQLQRGQYLVEGLGHCGECHTPRLALGYGGVNTSRWLAGGPAPEGDGKIPNITPHASGIGAWSEEDIVYYLESGFTPDYDSAGGSMVDVQQNMAKLPKSDLEAIAKYLKAIPEVASD